MNFKFLLNIVFLLVSSTIFSQTFHYDSTEKKVIRIISEREERLNRRESDSILKGNRHLIGGGLEFVYYRGARHVSPPLYCNLDYKFPGFNIFYKYLLQNSRGYLLGFSAILNYRKVEGRSADADKWIQRYESIDLEILRLNIGVSFLGKFGKKKNLSFGPGISLGSICYSVGKLNFQNGYSNSGYTSEQDVNGFGGANWIASLNLEVNYRIRTNPKHYMIIGLKQSIENPDYFGYGKNLVSHFFLGYNF